ncbi:MAG TPA: DUF2867 domain-containing protein [Arenimonas sp.]|uniref:DUF2867 domain-containing protein n=1 Tax=Arenimonas sp. TaxID=1872635 RepID=UPI002D7E3B5D|nr:DUF2867 domain-containing protein [Arenimonas sp.]HEU0154138.1 DUF2867 domain-containing protein [Arenimonas sp.]
MDVALQQVSSFPSVRLASCSGGLPVEVSLIAQLGVGGGDALVASANTRQRGHAAYIDALDEPSARIGAMDLEKGDATALYTFSVGAGGHPFHRHAGHRVFTAISGSGGAALRFSTASDDAIAADPRAFVRALRTVHIPPDCLFTVRFGGGTWHQFLPRRQDAGHPALFALSCHTNELGGDLPEAVRARVRDNTADIPSLTETLPAEVAALLDVLDPREIRTVELSLQAPAASLPARLCGLARTLAGRGRARLAAWRADVGFASRQEPALPVQALPAAPEGSLLHEQLQVDGVHEDAFAITLPADELDAVPVDDVLAAVLEGFLERRPAGVSALMALRNVLVAPIRLRTSPLGCPVSSLLATGSPERFAGRFPVLAQRRDRDGRRVQVLLGADDRHLRFRTCVAVERRPDGRLRITLATRVHCLNGFGRFYLRAIDGVHRHYVSPALLAPAVAHARARLCPAPASWAVA